MTVIFQFIYSFFATAGFAVYFGAPKNTIFVSGISGALSWSLHYIVLLNLNNKIFATFLGALLLGILGEVLAVKLEKPGTIFITAGLVPLVPGAGMYYTMSYLVSKDFSKAIAAGSEVFFIAAAIAIGIVVSTLFSKSIRVFKEED